MRIHPVSELWFSMDLVGDISSTGTGVGIVVSEPKKMSELQSSLNPLVEAERHICECDLMSPYCRKRIRIGWQQSRSMQIG